MAFHRLTVPSYLGGLPSGFDYINNALSGTPAPADGAKVGGTNAGTYFDAFGEDATSSNANRSNKALAENCDYLDNVVNTPTPVLDSITDTAVGPVSSVALTGFDVFVGKNGTSNNQYQRDRLICIVDQVTGNDILDSTGARVQASFIDDGGGIPANVVGTQASGFYTSPTVRIVPNIPTGTAYRIHFARKSRLSDITDTTVDIGAFVANSLFTAQTTSAYALRFMGKVSRRTGETVDALACSILETPGVGGNLEPKSDSLYIDVDPTDDAGVIARALHIRAGRSGTPYTLLSVKELSKGADYTVLETPSLDMAFNDGRTAANNGRVALSSNAHPYYRMWEQDSGVQPDILGMHNRRWTVTCGDGVISSGDFEGSNAIEAALNFAVGKSVTKIRLFVKNGAYSVSSYTLATAGVDLTIEGESKNGVVISIDAASALTLTGVGARVLFRNLSFVGNVGYLALYTTKTTSMLFEDCSFTNAYIYAEYDGAVSLSKCFGGSLFAARRCTFLADASDVLANAFIRAQYKSSGVSPYTLSEMALVEDCVFTRQDLDSPILEMSNTAASNGARDVRWSFRRCTMNLGSTGTTGGNMIGNCGVLAINPGTSSALSIELLEWVDCNVYANSYSTPGTNSILLFLRISNATGGLVVANHIRISGGKWLCKATTQLSPFYIGKNVHDLDSGAFWHFVLEDVTLGNTGADFSNGAPHAVVSFSPGTAYWAAWVVGAEYIDVRNVRWEYQNAGSDSGQIWLHSARNLHVDGMHTEGGGAGIGASPRHRYRFGMNYNHQYRLGVVENATLTNNIGVVVSGVASGMFWLDAPRSTGGASTPHNAFLFRKCRVALATSVTSPAFYIEPALPAVATENGHVHYEECEVWNFGGHGFRWDAGTTYAPLKDLVFTRCLFDTCGSYGVELEFASGGTCLLHDVTFDHCTFRDCINEGVLITAPNAWVAEEAGATFIGNIFDNNKGAESADQVYIVTSSPPALGAAYGNRAAKDGTGRGSFNMGGMPSDDFRGTETSYSYNPTLGAVQEITYLISAGAVTANRRHHTAGDDMLHNTMRYA